MKSGMGTMAVMTGILQLSLTPNIPEQFRIAFLLAAGGWREYKRYQITK